MLPKRSTYAESYEGQTKLMYSLIEEDDLLKNIKLFEAKLALISKKNLIANLSLIKNF